MNKIFINILVVALLACIPFGVYADQVCKVSMMGRVCYEEGSAEAIAAHMKGDAVAEANKKKSAQDKSAEDASQNKTSSKK